MTGKPSIQPACEHSAIRLLVLCALLLPLAATLGQYGSSGFFRETGHRVAVPAPHLGNCDPDRRPRDDRPRVWRASIFSLMDDHFSQIESARNRSGCAVGKDLIVKSALLVMAQR